MLDIDIYQTLENRGNDTDVENQGPFICRQYNEDGSLKQGIREPWLGEGYYFWGTRIDDARWWGNTIYRRKGYVICKTTYDQHSPFLYDLVGVAKLHDEFIECAEYIMKERQVKKITFSVVLAYLKKHTCFNYKAIRVRPVPPRCRETDIVFPDAGMVVDRADKIQICFFNKDLLVKPFKIVEKKEFVRNQTI